MSREGDTVLGRKRLSLQESRLQTRERLLEAAAEVFSRQGFHAASVEEVAEEAGFSSRAIPCRLTLFLKPITIGVERKSSTGMTSDTPQKTATSNESMYRGDAHTQHPRGMQAHWFRAE